MLINISSRSLFFPPTIRSSLPLSANKRAWYLPTVWYKATRAATEPMFGASTYKPNQTKTLVWLQLPSLHCNKEECISATSSNSFTEAALCDSGSPPLGGSFPFSQLSSALMIQESRHNEKNTKITDRSKCWRRTVRTIIVRFDTNVWFKRSRNTNSIVVSSNREQENVPLNVWNSNESDE